MSTADKKLLTRIVFIATRGPVVSHQRFIKRIFRIKR